MPYLVVVQETMMSTRAILDIENIGGLVYDWKHLCLQINTFRRCIVAVVLTTPTTIIASSQPMPRIRKILEYTRSITTMVDITVITTISATTPGPRLSSAKESIVSRILEMAYLTKCIIIGFIFAVNLNENQLSEKYAPYLFRKSRREAVRDQSTACVRWPGGLFLVQSTASHAMIEPSWIALLMESGVRCRSDSAWLMHVALLLRPLHCADLSIPGHGWHPISAIKWWCQLY